MAIRNLPIVQVKVTPPANPSVNTSPTIAFGSGGTGVSYQCALDSTTFTACTSPQSLEGLNANTPLAAGAHTLKVHAVQGRSTGPDISYAWTINTTAPTISSSPPSISASSSASLAFSHSAYTTFKCQLDNSGYRACTSPTAYTGVSSGWHTFQVKASDAAGADTSPASYSWFVIAIFPGAGTTGQAAGQTAATHTKSGVTELSVANGHGARAGRRQGPPASRGRASRVVDARMPRSNATEAACLRNAPVANLGSRWDDGVSCRASPEEVDCDARSGTRPNASRGAWSAERDGVGRPAARSDRRQAE